MMMARAWNAGVKQRFAVTSLRAALQYPFLLRKHGSVQGDHPHSGRQETLLPNKRKACATAKRTIGEFPCLKYMTLM
jgi:hypothetical protein